MAHHGLPPSGLTVERDGALATIVFDEVQLKLELLTRLALAIYQLEADEDVHAIVLTGRRNVFLSGADLKEFDRLVDRDIARKFIEIPRMLMERIYHCSKVTIAAINGYCLGGGLELALACDFRVCADRVLNFDGQPVPFLGLPEVSLGVVSPLGSSYYLPRLIGLAQAKALMLTAEPIDADRALGIGLVHRVVPAADVREEAARWARRVTGNGLFAVRQAKDLLNRSHDRSSVRDALLAEEEAFAACCETVEKRERIGARVRPPAIKRSTSNGRSAHEHRDPL